MKKIILTALFVAFILILAYAPKTKLATFGRLEFGPMIREVDRENREGIIAKNRPKHRVVLSKKIKLYAI